MSYSIREAVRDYESRGQALQAVAERFPDAHQDELSDGSRVWVCYRVKPTGFSLHVTGRHGSKPDVQVHFYEEVAGVRVYDPRSRHAATFIDNTMNPKLRAELLAAMLDGAIE